MLRRRVRALPRPVLVEPVPDFGSSALAEGVLVSLIDSGVDARYPNHESWVVGDAHTTDPEHAGARLLVAAGDLVRGYDGSPDFRTLARFDELTPAERAELDRIKASRPERIADLPPWRTRQPTRARRYDQLIGRDERGGVYLRVAS